MAEKQASGSENDDLLNVLSDPANQAIVSYFNDLPSTTTTLSDLSTFLVENMTGEKDTSVLLQHKCLPELAYFGLLEYDAERNTVEWLRPDELQSLQECVDQFDGESA